MIRVSRVTEAGRIDGWGGEEKRSPTKGTKTPRGEMDFDRISG
jgi:hypothetical protein